MKIQKVFDSIDGRTSYTVVTDDYEVVEPVESYLASLSNLNRSPNTIRSYATSLASWLGYLDERSISWDTPRKLEILGNYAGWLSRAEANTVVLKNKPRRTESTVNLYLQAIYSFYSFHSKNGISVIDEIIGPARNHHVTFKPYLYGLYSAKTTRHLVHYEKAVQLPKNLPLDKAASIVSAPKRLRDKFLFLLLLVTGMRIGQALGLRHSDFISRQKTVKIVSRDDNANGARSKRPTGQIIGESPITTELVHMYSDYMHEEYGDLDSDYIFVNLWSGEYGKPMTYNNVNDLIIRTRSVVGFHFTAHQFRHTFATIARTAGVSIDILSKLLTHRSVTTTSVIYAHLDIAFVRQELVAAGVLENALGRILTC